MNEPSKKDKSYAPVVVLIAAFIAIFLAWLLWGSILVWWTATYWRNKLANDGPPDPTLTIAELGQIGDLFGGVNSLFASFAFIGVAFAAYYQRKTYLQQLKDSEDNKKALAASNETNAALLSNANHELFIGVFLRMVEELQKTAANAALTETALQKIETEVLEIGSKFEAAKLDLVSMKNFRIDIESYYNRIYESESRTLRPFNKVLYQTFMLIQESGLSYLNQDKYAQIAIASIDDKVWPLIMMYGITGKGERLQTVIEKYGILEHTPSNSRAENVKHLARWLYTDTAFQSPEQRELVYDKENAMERRDARNTEKWKAMELRANKRLETMKATQTTVK